jgi:hypothetical protein
MSEVLRNGEEVSQGGQSFAGGQTIVINQQANQSQGVGTAGFVLALIAIFLFWVPFLNWILWALGLILSFAGLFKAPRGLAITGFVLSVIGLVLILAVAAAIAALFAGL